MATDVTKTLSGVNATCTVGGSEDWVEADFKFVVKPDLDDGSYEVKVYVRVSTPYNMQWSGTSVLRVKCNGVKKSKSVDMEIHNSSGGTTKWDGPVTFNFGAPGDLELDFDVDLDLTSTTGTNGRPGIWHTSDGGNLTHFDYSGYKIDVTSIPLLSPPTISNLVNTNKYKDQNGISADMTSISLQWDSTGDAIDNSYYKIGSNGSWVKTSDKTSQTITGLTAGTSYTIYVYSENAAGTSSTLNITVRTRHQTPVVSLSLININFESLTFGWISDKDLASCEYKVDNSSTWINLGQTGKSGSFTVTGFVPNSTHTIYFRGISTSTYDSLNSNETNASGTTADIAHINSIGNCIFGLDINIDIPIPEEASYGIVYILKLKIWTVGNSREPLFIFDDLSPGPTTIHFTQNQLDDMYKCFTNQNNVPIHFLLSTYGETKEWNDVEHKKVLNLTGIAKTAHIGINDVPRRAEAFIGINDVPKRAVIWVGDENNIPRRCI